MKKVLLSLLTMVLVAVLFGCGLKTTTNKMNLPDINSVKNFSSYNELKEYLKGFYEEQDGYYQIRGGFRLESII